MSERKIVKQRSEQVRTIWRAVLLAAGAAFMIIGITRGEMATVLLKATNICLECIGIG